MVIPDSIMYPAESDSTYPYTDDGNREFLEGKPFIEPFTLIPFLAAVTEARFTTFVVKLRSGTPSSSPSRSPPSVLSPATALASVSAPAPGPRTTPPPTALGTTRPG